MSEPPIASRLVKPAWSDFRQAWRGLVLVEVLFKLFEAWLLVPAIAWVLSFVLARTGQVAVSNRDVLGFLLSPWGLLYVAIVVIVAVALLLLEQAGLMAVVQASAEGPRTALWQLLAIAWTKMWRITQLGAAKALLLTATFVPFMLIALATYGVLLTRYDIYFYWKERPPIFWLAVTIGVLLLVAALSAAVWLYVRWAFALPILLFERQPASAALRLSHDRTRGQRGRIARLLLGWLLATTIAGLLLMAGFRALAAVALGQGGERPVALILTLLLVQGALLAGWSFVTVVGLALLTRQLYLQSSPHPEASTASNTASANPPTSPWTSRLAYAVLALLLLTPLALWADLSRYLPDRPPVQITAHRGHARAAPENTLSAIRKAIESGADYAEIDVQQTADGVIVLLHDRDLRRVTGDSRRIAETTYDEVRLLDAGRWFSPAFAGERIPTLQEAVDLARGRIKLNIELKFYGPDRQLAPAVARLVRDQQFEQDCLVTSLNYDGLVAVRQADPALRTGLIVAHSLGNLSGLEFDALSVRADFLTDDLLRATHQRGREVHVWTVNDPRQMSQMLQRGVDNLITSDPDLAIRVREQWNHLTPAERLVLSARLLLGVEFGSDPGPVQPSAPHDG